MQAAFISDLHANFEALKAVTAELERADCIICLGDLVGYYCQVNEVVDYCRQREVICLLGNHDRWALTECPASANPAVRFGIRYAAANLTPQNRAWLETLPLSLGLTLDSMDALLCHGSPWNPLGDYLYEDEPRVAALQEFGFDLVAFGQTHRQLIDTSRPTRLLNPGSVGQSRDGQGEACLALLDTETREIRSVRRAYDAGGVIRLARHHGAGEWITKHLEA